MTARRILFLVLAAAMQLLAWSDAVPACVSMAHCTGIPAASSHCAPSPTIAGTDDCCTGGSVGEPVAVSPLPERSHSLAPETTAVDVVLAEPAPAVALEPGPPTVDVAKQLSPLRGGCILRN